MLPKLKAWFSQPQDVLGAALLIGVIVAAIAYVLIAGTIPTAVIPVLMAVAATGLGAIGIPATGALGSDIVASMTALFTLLVTRNASAAVALLQSLMKIAVDAGIYTPPLPTAVTPAPAAKPATPTTT